MGRQRLIKKDLEGDWEGNTWMGMLAEVRSHQRNQGTRCRVESEAGRWAALAGHGAAGHC